MNDQYQQEFDARMQKLAAAFEQSPRHQAVCTLLFWLQSALAFLYVLHTCLATYREQYLIAIPMAGAAVAWSRLAYLALKGKV